MQKKQKWKIPFNLAGMPIDKAILELCPSSYSRREIRNVLDKGGITANGERIRRAATPVYPGDIVLFDAGMIQTKSLPELTRERIIYEDANILVVDKPAGLISEKAPKHSVIDWAQAYPARKNQVLMPCHRLDKETSGLLILAKNKTACDQVMEEFRQSAVQKVYLAIVWGKPAKKEWEVSCFLSSLDPQTMKVAVAKHGQSSLTRFKLLKTDGKMSWILCYPKTGRTHQIRVHLSHLGLPIIGDKRYDAQHSERNFPKNFVDVSTAQALHALELEVKIGDSRRSLLAPPPREWRYEAEIKVEKKKETQEEGLDNN